MENDHKAVVVGIGKNIFVQLHGLLLVAAEEIDFDTLDTIVFQPFHFFLASNGVRHDILRVTVRISFQ